MNFFVKLFRANRTSSEVTEILYSVLERKITDKEWDDFISVKIADPELEKIRFRMEQIWVEDSEYLYEGSINPTELSPKGVSEIKTLISKLKQQQIDGDGGSIF